MNGHCLGRFWNIGPTQTMYLPGPWLKQGEKRSRCLRLARSDSAKMAGLKKPIFDQLRPEIDFSRRVGQRASANAGPAINGPKKADGGPHPQTGPALRVLAASRHEAIRSGTVWTDTRGEVIQAHGIGMYARRRHLLLVRRSPFGRPRVPRGPLLCLDRPEALDLQKHRVVAAVGAGPGRRQLRASQSRLQ